MAKKSQAQPPHHSVDAPITEKPSGTAENGCAMTTAPASSRTRCRADANTPQGFVDGPSRNPEPVGQLCGARRKPLVREGVVDGEPDVLGVHLLNLWGPHPQREVCRRVTKVRVGGEKGVTARDRELREERIDRSDLNTPTP